MSNVVAEASNGSLMGYMIAKAEGEEKLWHGHVSAVTVRDEYLVAFVEGIAIRFH